MLSTNKPSYNGGQVCEALWLKSIRPAMGALGRSRFGLEMEIFPYDAQTLLPLGAAPGGFSSPDVLKIIHSQSSGSKVKLDDHSGLTIGVVLASGGNFSLEPGGQIEYSSRPTDSYDELFQDVTEGLQLLENAVDGKVVFLGTGTNPLTKPDHPLVVPKERYEIMTRYFNSRAGGRGVHMMRHTATVQPNIEIPGDINDWQDAVNLTLTLTPFVKHLFANSPWFQGYPSKYTSERQQVWPHVDPSRTGLPAGLPFADDTACAYAKWAKNADVFLVSSLPVNEQPLPGELTFKQWLENGYKGTTPSITDWELHLGTLFPDLRLRGFLEIRSIDGQLFENMFAPMAFFGSALSSENGRAIFWKVLEGIARGHQLEIQTSINKLSATDVFQQLLAKDPDHVIFADLGIHQLLLETALEVLESQNESTAANSIKWFINWKRNKKDFRVEFKNAQEFVNSMSTAKPSADFGLFKSHVSTQKFEVGRPLS